MTLAPLLFFGTCEGGLRLIGYGYPTDFLIEADDGEALLSNPEFGYRFFPRRIAPEPLPIRLEPKPEKTYRIFVFGGSAAWGESERTPHGIPGEEWFHEHVHFTFAGNHLVARALFLRIEGLLPDWVRKNFSAKGEPPSLAWCIERLRLTGLNRYMIKWMTSLITSRPPFTNQLDFPERQAARERKLEALEREFNTQEKIQQALETYEKAVAEHPGDNYFARTLGLIHWERKEWELGIKVYASLLQRVPNAKLWRRESATCHLEHGNVLLGRSLTEEARREFHRALELHPEFARAHYSLGRIFDSEGKWDEAVACYRRALEHDPGYILARRALAAR